MTSVDALNLISQQLHIYLGLPIMIFGILGGVFNLIIFTTLRTFRETACAFYLTTISLVNIIELLIALFVRILSEGFGTNIRNISWVCKVQVSVAVWGLLVSMTSLCLATIDQYTSVTKYHNFSHLRFAQRSILITCIIWCSYCICLLVYYDAHNGVCMIIDSSFEMYYTRFHFPILNGLLPITIMITFALLAYYNARTLINHQVNIVRLSRDRQLTAMVLILVVFVVITTLPYTIYGTYSLNQNSKNPEQIARSNLNYTITVLISYSSYAGSFYIYCCVSERFRKQLQYVLSKIYLNQCQRWMCNRNHNQTVPDLRETGDSLAI